MKKELALGLLALASCVGCEECGLCKDDELSVAREDYTGSLRTGGYYFGADPSSEFADIRYLYRNGVFLDGDSDSVAQAVNGTIAVDTTNALSQRVKSLWGVFSIAGDVIEIERWRPQPGGCETTVYERGRVLSDTAFVITHREYRINGRDRSPQGLEEVFLFRPLAQKPDSLNPFIP